MRKKKGFALIELLAVVGIVSMLTGVAIPVVGNASVKASAAANAANLRAVQSEVQTMYMMNPALFGDDVVSRAVEEVLTFNGKVTTEAPAAKGLRVGDIEIKKGTQMLVRLQSDNSVIATYGGFSVEDFSQIAGSGLLDQLLPILPSLPEDTINDLLGRLDQISSGYQPNTGYTPSTGYDPLFLTDVERMSEKLAEMLTAGRLTSDCTICAKRGEVCTGYNRTVTADGHGYMCIACGHAPGTHYSTVWMELGDYVADAMTCAEGGVHTWGENHKCKICGMEYFFTSHIYESDTSLNCKVCGKLHAARACEQGLHVYNSQGICGNCQKAPPENGPCECPNGEISGTYCARCGHSLLEHDLTNIMSGVLGACKHGHPEAAE